MMGWYTDLHSDLQTEIEKQIGAKPRIEVEVDPDNQSIPLVGKNDVVRGFKISRTMFFEPGSRSHYRVDDIRLHVSNYENFFDKDKSGGLVRDIRTCLSSAATAGDSSIQVVRMYQTFEAGDSIVICSSGNTDTVQIQSVTAGGSAVHAKFQVNGFPDIGLGRHFRSCRMAVCQR